MNYREIKENKKSRKKGFWYSIGIHAIIIALIFLPFMIEKEEAPAYKDVVVVDFSSASSMKGASANSSSSSKASQKQRRKTKTVKEINSSPPKEVLTQKQSKIDVPKVKNPPERVPEEYRNAPQELQSEPNTSEIASSNENSDLPTMKPIPVPESNSESGEGESGTGNGSGNNGSGNTDGVANDNSQGSGNASTGEGKSDRGNSEDNNGNGLFGDIGELERSVVSRPDVSKMIRENSIVKVRMCISRSGRVVDYSYEPEGSKVSDASLVKETLEVVSKYRFEKVESGPKLECGIFTIKVDMSNL